jgi:GNAT superfamily N-acetyltransferase
MTLQTLIRLARPGDLAAVDALLGRSYPRLLKGDYPPSVMVTVVPVIARARPELLASGRYFLAEDAAGRVIGAGGYSLAMGRAALAHIRQVATDPDALRQGIAGRLMQAIFTVAQAEGVTRYDCLATLTAVPFYTSVGFRKIGRVDVPILPGLSFPAVRMWRVA